MLSMVVVIYHGCTGFVVVGVDMLVYGYSWDGSMIRAYVSGYEQ